MVLLNVTVTPMVLLKPVLVKLWTLNPWAAVKFLLFLSLALVLSISLGLGNAWATPAGSTPLLAVAGTSAFHFAGDRPDTLGSHAGQLAPCPETPNCVSSQSADPTHRIAPLTYNVSMAKAMVALKQVIDDSERAEVIRAEDGYLYAEFTSRWMGFVDDVEFYLPADRPEIEVRSASRLGESDLGVNRQRIETIRAQLQALLVQSGAASN